MSDEAPGTQEPYDAVVTGPPVAPAAGQRPELAVAAAFAGGLLAAILLRRLTGD